MEPLAIIISVMTVLATPGQPARNMEPAIFPQIVTAEACPALAEDAKRSLTAHMLKERGVRVGVMTKCVGMDVASARLIRQSVTEVLGSN